MSYRSSRFARYAWAVLAYNVLVVLWGAFVRATGSGAGCGNHWPTCNGSVVPRAPQLSTIIEFTHRATSGIALPAIAGLILWSYLSYPRGHRVRLGATLAGVFILSEALIGAGLVLFEHVGRNASVARAFSLSIHLVNTFTLLAVIALTAWWASGGSGMSFRNPMRWPLMAALGGLIVLGISGAIAALGDTLFPVTSLAAGFAQDFSPSAHVFVRLRVFHPAIAIAAIGLLVVVAVRAMKQVRTPAAQRLGGMAIGLALIQIALGAMNLAMLAPVAMQLIHLAAADALWIVSVLFAAAVLSESETHVRSYSRTV